MGRYQEGEGGTGLSPTIQRLRPIYRNMAQMYVLGSQRPTELALHFGYTPGQVSRIIGSPCFQAEVNRLASTKEEMEFELSKDIALMAKRSLEILDEDLDLDPTEIANRKVRQTAALEVLGIANIRKPAGSGQTTIFNQFNDNRSVEINQMSPDEIRNEVLQLTASPSGVYGAGE